MSDPLTEEEVDWLRRWRQAEARPVAHRAGGPFSTFDELGRKSLRRLGLADYLLEVARSEPARVRRVPSKAIVEEGDDDAGPFSFVACPCGMRPVARSELVKCGGCERNYVRFEHGTVFVVYAGEVPPLVNARRA